MTDLYICYVAHGPAYMKDIFLEVESLGRMVCASVIVGDTGKLLSMEIIYTKLQQCITPRALINCVFLNFLIFAKLIGKICISVAAVTVFTIFLL